MADVPGYLPRHYTLGDEIRVTFSVDHYANLEEVWAVFRRSTTPRTTITFIDSVDETETLQEQRGELDIKRSTVVLASLVDHDHYPGWYDLYRVGVRTEGGRNIRVREASRRVAYGDASFVIEYEPEAAWNFEVGLADDPDED